jgi:hypothetical protein
MTRISALRAAFGWDQAATDLAEHFSSNWSRENVSKVLVALRAAGKSYRGPRGVLGPFFNLSRIAKTVFAPPSRKFRMGGFGNSPEQP